ncbi:MAG TPA: hypothetical protein VFU97_19425 [Xanthobacteraceae bacterium]|jgi:hypothetical protein|nr:hypothetical protein [Xanthobacteraceae bacterium]
MPKSIKRTSSAKKGKAAKPKRAEKAKGLTLGLAAFAKISAVEGITLRSSSRKMFADFDRRGLSPAQRRREIFAKHARKA